MARELQRRKNIIITWNHHAVDKCSSKKGTGTDILPKIEDQATNDQTDDGTSISAGYYMFVDICYSHHLSPCCTNPLTSTSIMVSCHFCWFWQPFQQSHANCHAIMIGVGYVVFSHAMGIPLLL